MTTGKVLWSEAIPIFPVFWRQKQKNQKFKVNVAYIMRREPFSKNKDCRWNSVAHVPSLCKGPWIQLAQKNGWMDDMKDRLTDRQWMDGWMGG